MADLKQTLTVLAERGSPVGPDEMVERIAARLADEPVVVGTSQRRKGWAMSVETDERQGSGDRKNSSGVIWAAAVFIVIVGAGLLYLALAGGGRSDVVEPTPTTTTLADATTTLPEETAADLAVITEYLTAWHDGDVDRAFEMIGADPAEATGSADWSRYEGLMNAEVEGRCAQSDADSGIYECVLSYESDLHRAVGAEPHTVNWTARVVDESTIEVVELEGENPMLASWQTWQNETQRTADSPCGLGPPSPDCADYQHANLEEWAVWYQANN